MLVVKGIRTLITVDGSGDDGLGRRSNVDLYLDEGRISEIVPSGEKPIPLHARIVDPGGATVIPGLIDCHTHTVFAGDRIDEFEMKIRGWSYEEIARQGGGILSTVKSTRIAESDLLYKIALTRLNRMMSFGVTTVEIKSGYGLDTATELKMLEVIRRLSLTQPLELIATFLGAHQFPPEYRDDRSGYIDLLVEEMLTAVAAEGLAEFCDVFCERGVFDDRQSRRILIRARELGLKLKVHAEEFGEVGAARLGIELGAISIDHLEHLSDSSIELLAKSRTIPVILPGTAFFLNLADLPPARKMLDSSLPVALGSDFNPGSNMCDRLPLMGTIAAVRLRMLPGEILKAMTINAARALDRSDQLGSIEPGKKADFCFIEGEDYRRIFYHYGVNHMLAVFKGGQVVWSKMAGSED